MDLKQGFKTSNQETQEFRNPSSISQVLKYRGISFSVVDSNSIIRLKGSRKFASNDRLQINWHPSASQDTLAKMTKFSDCEPIYSLSEPTPVPGYSNGFPSISPSNTSPSSCDVWTIYIVKSSSVISYSGKLPTHITPWNTSMKQVD